MKLQTSATFFLGSMLIASSLPTSAPAADLSQLTAAAAKWESGQSREPLQQVEQLVRESAGQRAPRAELEAALVKLLGPASTFEARRFACQQLAVVGSDTSVPAIAGLLQENETIGIACLAFGNRPSAKADQALRAALPAARDQGRLQIISTLGNRRDAKSVKPLARLVHDADPAVSDAAVRALGRIANAPAGKVIAALRQEARPPINATLGDASLRCADELAKSGRAKAASAIYEELVAPSQPANIRRGAFQALARLDQDGGEQRILKILRSGDAILKPVAIAAVRSLPSATASETFARELPSLSSQEQVWLIESLAARADAPACAAISRSLESPDAGVRRAAATALGQIGGVTAVPPLATAIAAAQDGDEVRALVSALGSLPENRDTDQAIIAAIKQASGDTRARLISALASRRSPQVIAVLFEATESPDPVVVKAAYRVLAKSGAEEQLPALLGRFAAIRNPELRAEVEGFVEQAVVATTDIARRSDAVRAALMQTQDVETRCALLRLLPACGDAQAISVLKSAAGESDPRVRVAAIRALAEWPDASAWETLATFWQKPENEAERSMVLRGLVRLAGEANAHPDEKLLARYAELLQGARGNDELKLILGSLGGAADPGALKLALPLLDNAGVRAEAEVAVKQIAAAVKGKHPEAAQAALDRLGGK